MSRDRFDVLERFAPLFEAPEPSYERFLRRRDRKRRNQRIAAGVVGIAVFVAAVWAVWATIAGPLDRTRTPANPGPSVGVPRGPGVDYVIDLNTGAMTPLPEAIFRSLGKANMIEHESQYAVSSHRSHLAYVGIGQDGTSQIFIARLDGTRIRQMTHDPTAGTWPAWSPDGTTIAYVGYGGGDTRNLFVLDVATGESTQITHDTSANEWRGIAAPQFTPDGSSLLYTGSDRALRTVPVDGGESTILFGRGRGGLDDVFHGSLSPDGSLVTMWGGARGCCARLVANADGTELRSIPGFLLSNPAGTWSPDGTRIVCWDRAGHIIVVDVATGVASPVAGGRAAIWLDDHTLLVEA